jgi:hypothetical protein
VADGPAGSGRGTHDVSIVGAKDVVVTGDGGGGGGGGGRGQVGAVRLGSDGPPRWWVKCN